MKLLRMAAAMALALASAVIAASPAHAGGWATTLLDPLPEELDVGRAYTVGYWVLQHGSHPYQGDMGETGLRLVDASGKQTHYAGTKLPEAGHYAVAIVFPRAGTWRLHAVQGVFADYKIGSVTVPGGVKLLATPPAMTFDDGHGHGAHWGAIHPPGMAGGGHDDSGTPATGSAVPAASTVQASGVPWLWPVAGVLVVALLLVAGWRWRRR